MKPRLLLSHPALGTFHAVQSELVLVLSLVPDEVGEGVELGGVVLVAASRRQRELDLLAGPGPVGSGKSWRRVVGFAAVPVLVRRCVEEDQGHDVDVPHAVDACNSSKKFPFQESTVLNLKLRLGATPRPNNLWE